MTRTNPTNAIIPKQYQWKITASQHQPVMLKTLKVRRFFCHLLLKTISLEITQTQYQTTMEEYNIKHGVFIK